MDRFTKSQLPTAAQEAQPATGRPMAAVTGQAKLATVVAAWPAGASVLAQAVEACQRRDAGLDLPLRLSNSFVPPQAFCD